VSGRIHHIGWLVADVESAAASFAESLGAEILTGAIHDPLQKAAVLFLRVPADPVQWELVAPVGEGSPLTAALARGGGFHHVCYEVDNLAEALSRARSLRGVVVRPPKPAVAFEGRRIAWVMTAEKLLIEYLERKPAL
jgi:methylmalonyl-CoA/ethylmalonyl-CoA epimerase